MNTNEHILYYTHELRLSQIKKEYKAQAEEAAKESLTYETYLQNLLEVEYKRRIENRHKQIMRKAYFPQYKYLADLRKEELPAQARKLLPQLERLDFIDSGQNVIMAGNPGTGKTHLAIALGIKACQQGKRVLFTTIPRLLTQIRECRSEKTLRALEFKFEKYDLVICDEFGYVGFDKDGTELIFNHLSLRAGKKSTIITTNLPFDRWTEIFNDPIITAAMVDRIAHKAFFINMNGTSYRVKETKEWLTKEK